LRRSPIRIHRRAVIAAVPLVLGWCAQTVPASGNSHDQKTVDGAVAVFNERLTDAGWISSGPPPEVASVDIPEEERVLGNCLNGFDVVIFRNTEQRLEGETARAFSDDFRIGDLAPDSTDPLPDYGYIAIGVFTVSDSSSQVLDEVVRVLGAEATASCLRQPGNVQGDVTITNDIGVGDATSQLELSYSVDDLGQFTESLLASRVDRSLVTMVVATSGRYHLDIDPVAELTAVLEALS
jgi:hypothetical protein